MINQVLEKIAYFLFRQVSKYCLAHLLVSSFGLVEQEPFSVRRSLSSNQSCLYLAHLMASIRLESTNPRTNCQN